jgi:cyclopropane fatty-acyl-phospholipid synthase-like methyltransferase
MGLDTAGFLAIIHRKSKKIPDDLHIAHWQARFERAISALNKGFPYHLMQMWAIRHRACKHINGV